MREFVAHLPLQLGGDAGDAPRRGAVELEVGLEVRGDVLRDDLLEEPCGRRPVRQPLSDSAGGWGEILRPVRVVSPSLSVFMKAGPPESAPSLEPPTTSHRPA